MATSSSYLLTSSAPVRFKPCAALVYLVQSILVFSISQTAGVTHWKLQDNAITPAATDLSASGPAQQDDLFAMSLPSTDPEFAVLLRHATKVRSPVVGNRGKGPGRPGGRGAACPVVGVSLDDGPGESRQHCAGGGGRKSTASSDTAGSCGRQCSCRGDRSNGGATDGCARSVNGGGSSSGGTETGTGVKQPRNPDGSGLMYV